MKTQNISKLRRQQVPLKQPTNGLSKDRTRDFPIVGIGASAGGLAMELFLKTCRNIQVWRSLLFNISILLMWNFTELLQRNTAMEVLQVTDRLKVLPDHIYVIPPNKSLTILNGVLHLLLFKVGGCDYRSIYSFVP
jgi:two-component system CheB/CheR fusion protein